MNIKQFKDRQYQTSVMAGMNQRYHQSRAQFWTRWDKGSKVAVGVLAVLGACFSILTLNQHSVPLGWTSVVIAGLAAGAAIALNVIPLGEWANIHWALFQRWT